MQKQLKYVSALILSGSLLALSLTSCGLGEQAMIFVLNQRDLTSYKVRDTRMYLAGELNSRTPEKIKKAISDHPKVTTLVLTDMPGSLDDEALFPFATWVRERGLNTHLQSTSKISSGAVDFFLAGNERTMEKGAKIGVHSWGAGDIQALDLSRNHPAHRMNAEYIARMLGSEDFYWFTIYAASANDIYWMSTAEIVRYGLLTSTMMERGAEK